MSDSDEQNGIRDRLQRGSEEALGKVVQDLIENPIVTGTIARAFGARERASQAQEVAMGALNLPSAADLARLTRRVRSVGQRLEGVEDSLDRLESRLGVAASGDVDKRLAAIEDALTRLEASAAVAPAKPESTKPASSKPAARKPAARKPAARKPAAKPAA
jgi:hypothetical protein